MEKENDMDSLARMVAEGFSTMQKNMDERFDTLEKEVRGVEKEVRTTNTLIDTVIRPELDDHARRIKDLEVQAA